MSEVLLVGDGRLATSLGNYLPSCGITLTRWSRKIAGANVCPPLWKCADSAEIVLIAISDDAIELWVKENAGLLAGKKLVHFSGALATDGIAAMHPLYAFPPEPVPLDIMVTIPFVCDANGPTFGSIFPTLPNPHYRIEPALRPYYHALAVLFGNMTSHIWNQTAISVWDDLGIAPTELLKPYLLALQRNFEVSPFDSLTGPVKRRDLDTVNRNLDALRDKPALKRLYEVFLETAWQLD